LFVLGSLCGAALFTGLFTGALTADAGPPVGAVGTQYSDVAEGVLPAVVWIETTTITQVPDGRFSGGEDFFRRFFDESPPSREPREFRRRGLGSGVIIDEDGYIVTNHHVAGEADELEVTLSDGRKFDARLVGTDPGTDLAVIKLTGDVSGLTALDLGDSDALRLGEVVMAIGNPFGLAGSVSLGIVSAKERTSVGKNRYENFIQTDAAINQGNSGGALVNMRGELVGINDMIVSPGSMMGGGGNVGIGFAIPTNQARPIIDSLITKGRVDRGWLGVHIQNLTPAMTAGFSLDDGTRGVILAKVAEGSPAEKAGVRDGDVVVALDGTPTQDTDDLRNLVAAAGPGHDAKLEIYRNGKRKRIVVKLGEMPGERRAVSSRDEARESDRGTEIDGLYLGELDDHRSLTRFTKGVRSGVVVLGVVSGSAAADAELRTGDIIVEVNRAPVGSVADFKAAVKSTDGPPLLLVRRGEASIYSVLD